MYSNDQSKKEDGKINLITYTGTKGLEFDTVYVMDFHFALMNRRPSNQQFNEHKYLLYVALSRAINKMVIFAHDNLPINP